MRKLAILLATSAFLLTAAIQVRAEEVFLQGSNAYYGTSQASLYENGTKVRGNTGGLGLHKIRFYDYNEENGTYSAYGNTAQAFCGDVFTNWSSQFDEGKDEEGNIEKQKFQVYKLKDLPSSVLSNNQKSMLQTLYDYTYSYVDFNEAGNITDNYSKILLSAIQFATWEIIHETSDGALGLSSGNFKITTGYATANSAFALASAILENISNGVTGTWEITADILGDSKWISGQGTVTEIREEDVLWSFERSSPSDITVYVPVGAPTQMMIQVTSGPGIDNVTPEPATLLILGLGGLAGIPVIRRRMKK